MLTSINILDLIVEVTLVFPGEKYKHDVELESKHKTGKSLMLNLKC